MSAAPSFLVSYPPPGWRIRGGVNFRSEDRAATNPRAALSEWLKLADSIAGLGGVLAVMPPPDIEPPLTGLIYAANHGSFIPGDERRFIVSNMYVEHRKAEQDHIARFVENGLEIPVTRPEAVWEGQADVATLRTDRLVLTWGVRTVAAASDEYRRAIPDGVETLDVQLRDPWFHGDTCLSALTGAGGQPLLLVHEGAFIDTTLGDLEEFLPDVDLIEVSKEDALNYACNALQIADTLLVPEGVSDDLLHRLSDRGLNIQPLSLGEVFGKGGGGPRCLVNVLRGLPAADIPHPVRYDTCRDEIAARVERYPEQI